MVGRTVGTEHPLQRLRSGVSMVRRCPARDRRVQDAPPGRPARGADAPPAFKNCLRRLAPREAIWAQVRPPTREAFRVPFPGRNPRDGGSTYPCAAPDVAARKARRRGAASSPDVSTEVDCANRRRQSLRASGAERDGSAWDDGFQPGRAVATEIASAGRRSAPITSAPARSRRGAFLPPSRPPAWGRAWRRGPSGATPRYTLEW